MLSIQNVIAHLWREKVLFAFVISDDPVAPGDGEGERHDEDGWHGLHQRLKLGKLMTKKNKDTMKTIGSTPTPPMLQVLLD